MEGLGFEETPSVTGWEMVIAPCTLLPVGAALLALTATIVVVKFARARPALAFSRSNLVVEHGAEPSMWTLRVQIGVSFALATAHAISLGVGIFLYPTPAPIVIDIAETIFTIVWISIAVMLILSLREFRGIPSRSFSWVVIFWYALSFFIDVYRRKESASMPILSLCLGAVKFGGGLTFGIAERYKPDLLHASVLTSSLNQPLLSSSPADQINGDIESGQSIIRRRKRSWTALVGIAAAYMWPQRLWLQVRAVICVVLIIALRLLNLAVPIAYKRVIDEFSKITSSQKSPSPTPVPFASAFLPWVGVWLVLYFLQGGGGGGGAVGLISNLRSYLWIPISQASFRRVSLDVFSHVLRLDHGFHVRRRTGEILRIMDRGTASMQTLLGTVVFQIGPAIFDITAAAIFLALRLRAWIAIIVFTTLGAYIPMTIILTEWRGKFRRELNSLDNARGARATDALLNYETVKLFGNEPLEERQYAKAIDDYQRVDYKLSASMNALNVAQSGVVFVGMAAGMTVCTAGVADGSLTVGDVVLFVTLMQQLYAPLNFFGSYYRMLQSAMLDMEGIFDLLGTKPAIKDAPGASPLPKPTTGIEAYGIEFRDISFSYVPSSAVGDSTASVLKGVNFVAPAGQTTALVGETGSGKSSILKLLLRFYDPQGGSIFINGNDCSQVTLSSLRSIIGVVPQDTVLFNDTISYNIRYGRPSATEDEVRDAAEGACIAETIETRFPLGFNTIVGERGLRLSGGEKQRVAFARAILKNPPILVLDEATSALDSITERRIQSTLASKRHGRTVLVVAHRLSTIRDADRIVVMRRGEIAEVGSHEELLEREGGLYAEMWAKQAEGIDPGPASASASYAGIKDLATGSSQSNLQVEGTGDL